MPDPKRGGAAGGAEPERAGIEPLAVGTVIGATRAAVPVPTAAFNVFGTRF